MCSQNVNVPAAVVGMATCCHTRSVWDVPYPSSHPSHVPECAGSAGPFCPMTPAVCVHDTIPDSKPGLSRRFPPPPDELTVSETVVEWVADVPVPVTVTV